jgi:DNA-binding MarR family transcriptional regulator
LVRERDADDARAYAVALTPAGDRLRAEAFELLLA